jgi:hypothetical protein
MSRRNFFSTVTLSILVMLLAGCDTPPPRVVRRVSNGSFQHPTYGYSVMSSGTPDIVSPDWSASAPGNSILYFIDMGGASPVSKEEPSYDLKLQHSKRASRIWLRAFPISPMLRDKELRVLMQDVVAGVAGAGYEVVQVEREKKTIEEKRYAAEIIEQGDGTLAGAPAYVVTIDVANIDQIKLTPGTRQARVELVLRHTDFKCPLALGVETKLGVPVLLMAGYANLPEDFATDRQAFHDLLSRIDIGGKSGFKVASHAAPAASTARP